MTWDSKRTTNWVGNEAGLARLDGGEPWKEWDECLGSPKSVGSFLIMNQVKEASEMKDTASCVGINTGCLPIKDLLLLAKQY